MKAPTDVVPEPLGVGGPTLLLMRVALVSPYDPFPGARDGYIGGVERVFGEFAVHLDRLGHDVSIICSARPDSLGPGQEPAGIEMLRVPRRGTVMRAPVASLAPHLPEDADIVHVPATYPFTTPAVIRRAQRLRIPCVLDFHFEPDPATTVGRAAAAAYRRVGPPSYQGAQTVMVRSLAYGRAAQSLSQVPPARWRVVPNGIDPQRFHAPGQRGDGGYLLFVGRLVPYKGVDVLLRALAQLPDAPPLWIAGDGPSRDELQQTAGRLGVDVRFLGAVDDDRLPDLYANARFTVLPSVGRQECFGITLLESMACGTPVIASALPGVEEIARRGGLVFTPGDPASLARTLQMALAHDVLPAGPRLAQEIHREFDWDAIAQRVHGVYEETIATASVAWRP